MRYTILVVGVHATGVGRVAAAPEQGGRGRWGSGRTRVDRRARTCPTRHPGPADRHRPLPSSRPGSSRFPFSFPPEPDCLARTRETDAANSCG